MGGDSGWPCCRVPVTARYDACIPKTAAAAAAVAPPALQGVLYMQLPTEQQQQLEALVKPPQAKVGHTARPRLPACLGPKPQTLNPKP